MVPRDLSPTPKNSSLDLKLNQLGEEQILDRLACFAPAGQLKDDTALINSKGKGILINTDVLVDGVHFSEATTSPNDIGWRAVATNLSDLAASGSTEIKGITVGLIAPDETPWNWVEGVYEGISEALNKFGGCLLGGDCSRGNQKILAITAYGELGPLRLLRSQAKPGDWLVVSGHHGLSRLGLAILLQREQNNFFAEVPDLLQQQAIKAHQRPNPRLDGLDALIKCKPTGIPWRAAGTDSSDGLLTAIRNLCKASGCKAILKKNYLPTAPQWPKGEIWDEWCLNGGEDFELVLSLPALWAKAWLDRIPESHHIGVMQQGEAKVYLNNGEVIKTNQNDFQHF